MVNLAHPQRKVVAYVAAVAVLGYYCGLDSSSFLYCCDGFSIGRGLSVVRRRSRYDGTPSTTTPTTPKQRSKETATSIGLSSPSLIEPGDETVIVDTGRGGVRLAQESVIQIKGVITAAGEVDLSDLFRYTQVTQVEESHVLPNVIYTGSGLEYYQHPDDIVGTEAEVRYGPAEAVKAAWNAGKLNENVNMNHISINFCGGKDAQVLEVIQAGEAFAKTLRQERIVPESAIIEFRSISDEVFPIEASCVTVVMVDDDKQGTTTADSITRGEVYRSQADGKYYTLLDQHINTAVE